MGWPLLAALAIGWLAICAAAFVLQDRLIYFPGAPPTATPAVLGLPFEQVALRTGDGVTLHAWWIPVDAPRGAAIVCHGNAGSIERRIELAAALRELGLSVLLFDYRGYGSSGGRPSEEGLYRDAEAAYAHVADARRFAPERIVAYGESLGGAVAAELALRRPVATLVLESAFTSLADVGAKAYPFLPVRLLLRSRFDTRAKLDGLSGAVLVMHSPHDEIVPFSHSAGLREAAAGEVRFLALSGSHNAREWLHSADFQSAVRGFLDAHLPAR